MIALIALHNYAEKGQTNFKRLKDRGSHVFFKKVGHNEGVKNLSVISDPDSKFYYEIVRNVSSLICIFTLDLFHNYVYPVI